MKFPFFVGLRYLFSKSQEGYLSLISWFSFVGIILGIVSLIVVLSVMNGFHSELRERILSVLPHAFVEYKGTQQQQDWQLVKEQLLKSPYVEGVAPFIEGKAMASVVGAAQGVQLNGILPQQEKMVSVIDKHMRSGTLESLQSGEFGIVIGGVLARQLRVVVGDSVKIMVPKVSITPAGIFPRMRYFKVQGIFEVGAQLDQDQAFIHLDDARAMYRLVQPVQGLRVNLKHAFDTRAFEKNLDPVIKENMQVRTWRQTHQSLFSAIKMEKTIVAFLLAVVIAVAAFNIISILSMLVTNKTSEIAVLRTMGATSKEILQIFLIYGLSMAFSGMIIGTLIAIPLAQHVGSIIAFFESLFGLQVFDSNIYYISKIPSEIFWQDILGVNLVTIILVFLASLYPAYKASQVEPAQALQYE